MSHKDHKCCKEQ